MEYGSLSRVTFYKAKFYCTAAIWAATLGFDLFAQRPRGEPGAGQTVGLGQVGELLLPFVAPDDDSDDDDAGAGNQVPINQLPIGPVLIAPEPNNAPPPPYIPQQLNYPITGDPLYDPAEGVLMNVPPGWNAADILWVLLHYGYEAPQELIDLVNAEGLQPGAALVGEEDEQPQPSSQHVVPAVMPVPDGKFSEGISHFPRFSASRRCLQMNALPFWVLAWSMTLQIADSDSNHRTTHPSGRLGLARRSAARRSRNRVF